MNVGKNVKFDWMDKEWRRYMSLSILAISCASIETWSWDEVRKVVGFLECIMKERMVSMVDKEGPLDRIIVKRVYMSKIEAVDTKWRSSVWRQSAGLCERKGRQDI